ncbi:MAG: serpin family protein, partial [Actinomycetota bacterium]|nr:serpin family protein [Actinomycetota bacterium]
DRTTETPASVGVAYAAAPPAKGDPATPPDAALPDAVNDVGFELLGRIDSGDGNTVISPVSVAVALAMTANGADGTTLDEMRSVLGLDAMTELKSNESWANLIASLEETGTTTLTLANSLWADTGTEFKNSFLDADRDYFGAEVSTLDLQSPGAPGAINAWVGKNTRGKITKIVGDIPELAVMYLVNATYFKGAWADEFSEQATRSAKFWRSNDLALDVSMMERGGMMDYVETAQFQTVRLPYEGDSTAMYVILPAKGASVFDLVDSLDADQIRQLRGSLKGRSGTLRMPKFTTRYERELSADFKALGIALAFAPESADFTRMADAEPGALYIAGVNHKTFLAIDEKGTEAAAVTSIEMGATGFEGSSAPPFTMVVDRPYLTLIVDERSGTVLFAGAIRDPQ